jgi:hypothetical protein
MDHSGAARTVGIVLASEIGPMLRVITEQDGNTYRLELHGIVGGEWVRLLEEHWRSIIDKGAAAKVTVVLSDVDFIDRDGEQLLRQMADAGSQFVVSGCMNRYVIEKLQSECAQQTVGS